jgi:hypothetical protein
MQCYLAFAHICDAGGMGGIDAKSKGHCAAIRERGRSDWGLSSERGRTTGRERMRAAWAVDSRLREPCRAAWAWRHGRSRAGGASSISGNPAAEADGPWSVVGGRTRTRTQVPIHSFIYCFLFARFSSHLIWLAVGTMEIINFFKQTTLKFDNCLLAHEHQCF